MPFLTIRLISLKSELEEGFFFLRTLFGMTNLGGGLGELAEPRSFGEPSSLISGILKEVAADFCMGTDTQDTSRASKNGVLARPEQETRGAM